MDLETGKFVSSFGPRSTYAGGMVVNDGTTDSAPGTMSETVTDTLVRTDPLGKRFLFFSGSDALSDNIVVRGLSKNTIQVTKNRVQTNFSNITGAVTIYGQGGNDVIGFRSVAVPVYAYGSGGNDVIGSTGTKQVFFSGGDGNDVLTGGQDLSVLFGDNGNDLLSSSAHANLMVGGVGEDTLRTDERRSLLIGDSVDFTLVDPLVTQILNELAGADSTATINTLLTGHVIDDNTTDHIFKPARPVGIDGAVVNRAALPQTARRGR